MTSVTALKPPSLCAYLIVVDMLTKKKGQTGYKSSKLSNVENREFNIRECYARLSRFGSCNQPFFERKTISLHSKGTSALDSAFSERISEENDEEENEECTDGKKKARKERHRKGSRSVKISSSKQTSGQNILQRIQWENLQVQVAVCRHLVSNIGIQVGCLHN